MPPLTLELAQPPSVRMAAQAHEVSRPARTAETSDPARLRRIVDDNFAFIWRSLRRLGVGSGDLDDCAQQVFLVVSRKLESIEPGCERSFLFGTGMRVASRMRRTPRPRRRSD